MMHAERLDDDGLVSDPSVSGLMQDMVSSSGMLPWLDHLQLMQEDVTGGNEGGPLHLGEGGTAQSPQTRKRVLDGGIGSLSPGEHASRQRARHLDYGAAAAGLTATELRANSATVSDAVEAMGQLIAGVARAQDASRLMANGSGASHGENAATRAAGGGARGGPLLVKTEDGAAARDAAWSPGEVPSEAPTPSSGGPRRDKGLRSFSLKVCHKVEEFGTTTYNQVADELVYEFKQDSSIMFDEKNIRRRIYDALNVLMAMDIITRDKKNIKWKGFPKSREKERLELDRKLAEVSRELERKREEVEKKALQYVALCNLVRRNADAGEEDKKELPAAGGADTAVQCINRIKTPFVIVQTGQDTVINLERSDNKQQALLQCSSVFQVHDDVAVLERMGMARCASEEELRRLFANAPDVPGLLLKSNPGIVRQPPFPVQIAGKP